MKKMSHWNHLVCQECLVNQGLKRPRDNRDKPGPCCFCGGPRPSNLKGRGDHALMACSATLDRRQAIAQKHAKAKSKVPISVPKVLGGVTATVKTNEEEKMPRGQAPDPKSNNKPEKPKLTPEEREAGKARSLRMAAFVRAALSSDDARGSDEEFSYNVVTPKMPFGEAGNHPDRQREIGTGAWVGRGGSRTHFPKRAVLVMDRSTGTYIAMGMRWLCGDKGLYSKQVAKPTKPICHECFWSKYGVDFGGRKTN